MLSQIDAHGLRRHLVVTDGLERAAIGGVHQHDDQNNGHRGDQHRHKGGHAERPNLEVADTGKALQQVGAVGHGTQLAPLEDGADDLRKAQRGDGQIVALQPQYRQTDEIGEQRRHQTGQQYADDHAQHCAEAAQCVAQHLRERDTDGRIVVLIHRVAGRGGNGEDRVCIRADQHKPGVTQREQAGEAV